MESVLSTASARKAEENSAHLKDVQKKAKPHSLMQEVTTFLTSHYHFCFNVLTEVTEVACLENDVPDPHLLKFYKHVPEEEYSASASASLW